ncbi:MAG TPA: transglycosylase SLT domain-containing protein [Ancylobacter sp.]
MVAPSYAGWLTDPPRASPPGGWLIARGQVTTEIEVFQRVIAVPPPASTSFASIHPSLIPSSVPLPPKRLAEKRRVVVASLAPLPPMRLLEPMPADPEATAVPEPPPNVATAPHDATANHETDAPQEDAARPIDDGPEPAASRPTADRAPPQIEALILRYADRFDVPARLVRRVAWRESKFDPRRRNGPYWGLMQIRVDTARSLGFRGAPNDLLDADTNMTYAVAYLANAYRVAGRDEKRAVMLYAKGYYYEAKRKRMLDSLIRTAANEK